MRCKVHEALRHCGSHGLDGSNTQVDLCDGVRLNIVTTKITFGKMVQKRRRTAQVTTHLGLSLAQRLSYYGLTLTKPLRHYSSTLNKGVDPRTKNHRPLLQIFRPYNRVVNVITGNV